MFGCMWSTGCDPRARENLPNTARMLTRTLLLATTAGAAARKLALGTTTPLSMLRQQAQDQRRRAGWYYRDLDGYPSTLAIARVAASRRSSPKVSHDVYC